MNTTQPGDQKRTQLRTQLLRLNADRKSIEDEMAEYMDILRSHNMGMHESLVDQQGFPRADVDIYQVRIARNKIITLRNDCKDLMKEIESKLHEFHALVPTDEKYPSR